MQNSPLYQDLRLERDAGCKLFSAKRKRCNTINQTNDCGSAHANDISKQLRTLGSTFVPPNAATSPNNFGKRKQSYINKPKRHTISGTEINRNSYDHIVQMLEPDYLD
ncbi:hypothetical protein DERP_006032 [Dermatophagoides pteronyssinus]|uniref:Uncharacterized protein n=1 Tax=Dermatophagoides pteronyssinus TaxID=6956 RepID=A0ABQ8JS35_DERPT|nr:hypothetical protein DERP_006032 [Dermatophagoides pteronyssinus]